MRQSSALPTFVKRVVQRGFVRGSVRAPVKTSPFAAQPLSNTNAGSTLKHSQLWMPYSSSRIQWTLPVMQVMLNSSAASPDVSNKQGGKPGISGEEAAVTEDDVEPVIKSKAIENMGFGDSEEANPNHLEENEQLKDVQEDHETFGEEAAVTAGDAQPVRKADAVENMEVCISENGNEDLLKENERLKDILEDRETSLEEKDKTLADLKDRLLRSYADVENIMERARREAENSRKFAIQNFAKSILPVADNLGRAATAVPASFHSSDTSGLLEAGKLLGSLLEGVKMTEKELLQVFKKFGVEKFEPNGERFDPNFHLAICEVPDSEKEPGCVAVVFKAGYMLHDRVIRPAEVAVVKEHTG